MGSVCPLSSQSRHEAEQVGLDPPTPHIYSYNTDPNTFKTGYSYSAGERTARASSVAAASETGVSRSSRAMTAAPAASDLSGYSGFYGRQLAQHSNTSTTSSATSSVAKSVATSVSKSVTTAVTEKTSKSVEVAERSSKKVDFMKEHSRAWSTGRAPGARLSAGRRCTLRRAGEILA